MNNDDPNTPPQNPAGTGGDTPAATQPQGGAGASDDEQVTLSKKDYQALIGQRDRSTNAFKELSDTVGTLEAKEAQRDKQEYLSNWLQDNKQTYPDIEVEDLMDAESPEDLEKLAKSRQRRYEDIVQKKLLERTRAKAPILSPEERENKLKELRKNPDKTSFGKFLNLQQKAK